MRTWSPMPVAPHTRHTDLFTRSAANPLLSAADWPYQITSVSDPAAASLGDLTVLLCRVEDRHGTSHLAVARSTDGETGWRVDPRPLISCEHPEGVYAAGVENPRVTYVEELHSWVIAYTAVTPDGPCVALAATEDFRSVEPICVAIQPDNKDACLLPRRVQGEFVLFHRPYSRRTGRADVWLSHSADLRSWSAPRPVLAARAGVAWDSVRVGMGPPPVETRAGWLGVYHGVRQLIGGPVYRAGVVLLDLDAPERVLRRGYDWILAPTEPYERVGDEPNVVLPGGLLVDPATDRLRLYYGAAGTVVAMASASLAEVLDHVLVQPEDDADTEVMAWCPPDRCSPVPPPTRY